MIYDRSRRAVVTAHHFDDATAWLVEAVVLQRGGDDTLLRLIEQEFETMFTTEREQELLQDMMAAINKFCDSDPFQQ